MFTRAACTCKWRHQNLSNRPMTSCLRFCCCSSPFSFQVLLSILELAFPYNLSTFLPVFGHSTPMSLDVMTDMHVRSGYPWWLLLVTFWRRDAYCMCDTRAYTTLVILYYKLPGRNGKERSELRTLRILVATSKRQFLSKLISWFRRRKEQTVWH